MSAPHITPKGPKAGSWRLESRSPEFPLRPERKAQCVPALEPGDEFKRNRGKTLGISVITGASSGIGAAAALQLTRSGERVLITGRSPEKLRSVHGALLAAAPDGTTVPEPIAADLSSLAGVRDLAQQILDRFPRVDVLVNNAAVQPSKRHVSADGFELGLAVNHLAPFLLTNLLAASIQAASGRVITTASSSHVKGSLDLADPQLTRGWSGVQSYGRSKLANILFTAELQRRTPLPASCFHPGAIRTDINRDSPFVRFVKPFERFVLKPPEQGADTLAWLATSAEGGAPSAVYYADRAPADSSPAARDAGLAAHLWDLSMDLTGADPWPQTA
ncbi:SDR family NAD(P)-dependent oxidoreductase [Streptomyces sp. NPDC047434]|uniref:SDR family NAD(P)-dependent oxidoreductase n=1 Tax=Streptomyces sp. NPDC047434 TaxID=3155143 RepID=UPI0033E53C55